MRIVVQRVKQARVDIAGKPVAAIEQGLLLLTGFSSEDPIEPAEFPNWHRIIHKIPELRIFPDKEGKINWSIHEVSGEILVVSQFTLYASCKKGKRPSFSAAAPSAQAQYLYDCLIADLKKVLPHRVKSGVFGADMDLWFCNWGPVTIILDSTDFEIK
jgi:D-tyrosyl-tRNA(Tyr) deacylase